MRTGWRKPTPPSWMAAQENDSYPARLELRALRVRVRQRGFRARRYMLVTTLRERCI
jgi:hypothetical protein